MTGWLVGQAQIDDRWMLEAFLSTRQSQMQLIGPEVTDKKGSVQTAVATPETFSPAITVGMDQNFPYLADDGFNGERWIIHWADAWSATVIASPPANAHAAWDRKDKRWLSHHRQIVETVFSRLCEVFRLKRLGAHSEWGKIARLAATMAAYNLGLLFNRLLQRPDGALATLIV